MRLHIKVGRNKVNFDQIEWFKMYSMYDNRIVGKKGNMIFATYPKDLGERDFTKIFDPKLAVDQIYIDNFSFRPTSPDIPLVKIFGLLIFYYYLCVINQKLK